MQRRDFIRQFIDEKTRCCYHRNIRRCRSRDGAGARIALIARWRLFFANQADDSPTNTNGSRRCDFSRLCLRNARRTETHAASMRFRARQARNLGQICIATCYSLRSADCHRHARFRSLQRETLTLDDDSEKAACCSRVYRVDDAKVAAGARLGVADVCPRAG